MDVGWIFSAYIVVLALVTLVAVRFIPETAGLEMDRIPLPGEEKVSSEDESTAVPVGR
jgi:MHS family alpha-ketoglutarate permease-like MFS transporter